MPGSYQKRGEGKYFLTVSAGTGLGGKRKRFTRTIEAKNDEEAEKQLALFYSEVVRGKVKDGDQMKFKDFIERWNRDYVEKELEPKTIDSYKSELKKRIVPALGHIKLKDLKPLNLLDFYDNLQEDGIRQDGRKGGLSNKTISYYHRIISSALQTAVTWDLLDENPASRIKPPKVKKKEAKHYDRDQSLHLLTALVNEPLKFQVAILLDITTGLRRGELLALEWKDIDFKTRIITINKSSQYIPGKGVFTKDPKNSSSIRSVVLPKFVMKTLKQFKAEQNTDILRLGDKWVKSDRLFTQWNGEPMYPGTISHWFSEFIITNKLPQITFHGLRHTALTLLIEEGGFSYTAAGRVGGHANGQTTATIYAHTAKDVNEKAADVMDNVLDISKQKKKTRKKRTV